MQKRDGNYYDDLLWGSDIFIQRGMNLNIKTWSSLALAIALVRSLSYRRSSQTKPISSFSASQQKDVERETLSLSLSLSLSLVFNHFLSLELSMPPPDTQRTKLTDFIETYTAKMMIKCSTT